RSGDYGRGPGGAGYGPRGWPRPGRRGAAARELGASRAGRRRARARDQGLEDDRMDPVVWNLIIESAIKSVIILIVLLTGFAYMTFAERKIAALFQTRIGPNRAGPWGFLQPAADGVKLIFKEELIPGGADKLIFVLAPVITVIPALIILAVVPWGPPQPL